MGFFVFLHIYKDMNRNLWNFNTLLGFSALFVAGCAAFFSIWGIGLLFSGASVSSMIMTSSLELGKLVATSFLYRFWKRSQLMLKSYLCIAIITLMGITSLGIFGYLSSAYQQSSVKYTLLQDKISSLEAQKKQYSAKSEDVKKRIDSLEFLRKSQEDRLTQVNTNTLLARNPIQFRQVQEQTMELIGSTDKSIKDENDKNKLYFDEVDSIDKKLLDIKLNSAETKDIQTFRFVAEAMGVSLNTVAKWFILVLIFVFDPLAVALILAYNVAIYKEYEIYKVMPPTPSDPPSPPKTTIRNEDNKSSVSLQREVIDRPVVKSPIIDPVIITQSTVIDPIPTPVPVEVEVKENVVPEKITVTDHEKSRLQLITGTQLHN